MQARPRTFCLTSGKGGVGKTSLAVNLAYVLADRGKKVLLIDGDLGLANVDVLLGLPVCSTIQDIICRQGDPLESVSYLTPQLAILPASSGVPEMVTLGPEEHAQLDETLQDLIRHFEIVLVDTAAGIGPSVLWFGSWVDHIIVLVTPDPTSMTDAYALIKVMAQNYQRRRFHLLLNAVRNEQEGRQTFDTLAKVAERFLHLSLAYLGSTPLDPIVCQAIRDQVPFIRLAPNRPASQAVKILADRLASMVSCRPPRRQTPPKAKLA